MHKRQKHTYTHQTQMPVSPIALVFLFLFYLYKAGACWCHQPFHLIYQHWQRSNRTRQKKKQGIEKLKEGWRCLMPSPPWNPRASEQVKNIQREAGDVCLPPPWNPRASELVKNIQREARDVWCPSPSWNLRAGEQVKNIQKAAEKVLLFPVWCRGLVPGPNVRGDCILWRRIFTARSWDSLL